MPLNKLFLLFLIFWSSTGYCQSVERNVFKITVSDAGNKERFETGFRLKNVHGIVTALHGLVGYKNITAESKSNPNGYQHLKIVKIDIPHDIAVISNSILDNEDLSTGIEASTQTAFPSNVFYSSYGNPYGIAVIYRNDIKVAEPAIVRLQERIPPDEKSIYLSRKSPDISLRILELRYNFGNGESGAPILNAQNKVIAVNDGGFASINLSWAIPVKDIQLSTQIDFTAINRLAAIPVKLHSYQIDVEQITGAKIDELSNKFENWYYGLLKLYNLSSTEKAVDGFDKSTLSSRFINVLNFDNGDHYKWFYEGLFVPYRGIYIEGYHPVDFIAVNIDASNANRQVFTVYFRYNTPLYGIKFKPSFDELNFPSDHYKFDFDVDSYRTNTDVKEIVMVNVQATFIVDGEGKLVDITELKTILPSDPYFQNK